MSLIYDKGNYKNFSEIEQPRSKNYFNNYQNIFKNNNQKKNYIKNFQLNKEYESSSPIRNINNSKKAEFFTTYQNNSNTSNNYYDKQYNNNNKKNLVPKNLKYNKSFEGNLINNELMSSDNFDFVKEDLYTIQHGNNRQHKKFNNNSVILNNSKQNRTKVKNNKNNNKSVTRTINSNLNNNKKNKLEENLIIKKLDEKFKSLESNIIDKKYENDIDHDEMIISTNKKNFINQNINTNKIKTYNLNNSASKKLSKIIDDNNDNYNEDKIDKLFTSIFLDKNNIDFDENYLLNSSFENNRNDFDIMYTDNYEKSVINDMLSLEIKLLIEKMFELQKSYHKELNIIMNQYNKNEKIFKILVERVKMLQKQIFQILKLRETKNINGNIYNFIGVYNNNNKAETNRINKNEFYIWRSIMNMKKEKKNENSKEYLKDLFRKIIFDNYYKISSKINNIENKIILNLMRKYNYNINKKNNGFMANGSNGNLSSNNDKNNLNTASPIQNYKNMIKQNKNINNTSINNKKKHKKTSSCYQSKPSKYIYFKNGKQK